MFISDLHIPFEERKVVAEFFNAVQQTKPRTIIIGGDLIDFSAISSHVTHPDDIESTDYEIKKTIQFLERLRKVAGKKATIYWIEGNHEQRLIKYLMKNARELATIYKFSFDMLFELYRKDINVIFVESNTVLKIDNWVFRHGHEIGYGSSIPGNNARKGIYNYGLNYVQGHVHRGNLIRIRQFDKILTGIENPCACEINPRYANGFSGWHQGWTVLEKNKNGDWEVSQVIIKD